MSVFVFSWYLGQLVSQISLGIYYSEVPLQLHNLVIGASISYRAPIPRKWKQITIRTPQHESSKERATVEHLSRVSRWGAGRSGVGFLTPPLMDFSRTRSVSRSSTDGKRTSASSSLQDPIWEKAMSSN